MRGGFALDRPYRRRRPSLAVRPKRKSKTPFTDALLAASARMKPSSALLVSPGTYRRLLAESGGPSNDPGIQVVEVVSPEGGRRHVMRSEDCEDSTVVAIEVKEVFTDVVELILAWRPEFAAKVRR